MEENKELETTTEEQASVTPAANNGEKKGLFLSGLIVGFAATLLIVGGIFIAFQIHNIMTMKDDVAAQVSYGEDSAVNAQTIKKLQLLEDTVKENFYLSEVTNEQLEDGMFRGLMDSLDDPYSEYYTAEELNELTEQTQGIYFGIGAYVSMDSETNLPKISGVIEGAPAADVDLRANDIIYEVDGVSTAGAHHMDGSPFGKVFYILAAGCRPLPVVSVLSAHAVCAYAGAADRHVIGKAGRIQIPQGNVDSVDHLRHIASARAHK